MKRSILLLLALWPLLGFSQTVLFHENFDLPSGADSVLAGIQGGGGPSFGDTTSQLAVSPTQSYHIQGSQSNTEVFFETQSFSTINNPYVKLEFHQIAKIGAANTAKIYYSINGGSNWTQVSGGSYLGGSPNFPSSGHFNESSYSYWLPGNYNTLPDSSWWRKEVFNLTGLVSDTSGGPGNYTGYSNVKIKFEAEFNFPPSSAGYAEGWFVDNVNVTGHSCEFIEPQLSFNFQSSPCYINHPKGQIEADSSNTYPVGILATDAGATNSGIDSVSLHYRINNSSWDSIKMIKQTSGAGEYLANITGAQPGDSVEYFIEAYDLGCPNLARAPATGSYLFIPEYLPSICGTGSCQNSGIISSFPWQENFEGPEFVAGTGLGNSGNNHRGGFPIDSAGNWEVFPQLSLDYGWSVRTGPTGTNKTGPSGDHTTGTGKYVYTEYSPRLAPGVTLLNTPCIDLRDSVTRLMSFYYHMYGSDIQGLRVDVDTGTNSPAYWNAYLKIDNAQQSSSLDSWKQGFISLQPFAGKIIKLRFRVPFAGGPGDENDVALDDFEIRGVSADDIEVVSFKNDFSNSCTPNSNIPISIILRNQGSNPVSQLPLAYQLDNGTVIWDTLGSPTLNLTDTTSFTFSQPISYSTGISHTLKVWAAWPNDSNGLNDTIQVQFTPASTSISQLPHVLDFENGTAAPTGPGSINDASWTVNPHSLGAYFAVFKGLLNNTLEGPMQALGKNGKAIILRNTPRSPNTTADLESSCIDLTNATNPRISFNLYLENGRQMKLKVRETGDVNWSVVRSFYGSGTLKSNMPLEVTSLSPYTGKQIQLALEVNDNSGGWDHQVAVDNILIKEVSQVDLGLFDISSQLRRLPAKTLNLPSFDVDISKNANQSNFPSKIVVEFKDKCQPTAPVYSASQTFNFYGVGATNHIENFTGLTLNDSLPAGLYQTKVWLETTNDSLHFNDTLYFETMVQERQAAPYYNDFESCNSQFYSTGTMKQWERVTPPGGAQSGNYAYETNADTSLNTVQGSPEFLVPPQISGLDTIIGEELRFWHKFNFIGGTNQNHGKVEYFDGSSFKNLTQPNLDGQNWKSYMSNPSQNGVFYGNTGGWIYSSYPIDHVSLPDGRGVLRFVTESDNPVGNNWTIDDFEIYVPPQNSASPAQLAFLNGIPALNNSIAVRVYNSGRRPLDEVEVAIYDQSGSQLLQEQLSLSSAIAWQKSRQINLQGSLSLNQSIQELVIVTSRPNSRNDAIPNDDTLKVKINLLQPVNSLPYCVDFESGQELLGFSNGILDTLWNYGPPSKNTISSAYSGTHAWTTGDSGTYPPLSDNYLYTPLLPVDSQKCYQLSFWHWYDTEYNFDGANVEYSLDSGKTWSVLGEHGDTTWYNTPYVQALDAINPGFSGSSGGWIKSWQEMDGFSNSMVQFRFRFSSGATIHGDGWAIDDVCFEEVGSKCQTTDLDENTFTQNQINLYPNPAHNEITIIFKGSNQNQKAKANTRIFDQTGKLIRSWEQKFISNAEITVDISDLPVGIYSLNLQFGENQVTKSFIKN